MNFKGQKGPGVPIILAKHQSAGGKAKEKARQRSIASKRMAAIVTKPLEWGKK